MLKGGGYSPPRAGPRDSRPEVSRVRRGGSGPAPGARPVGPTIASPVRGFRSTRGGPVRLVALELAALARPAGHVDGVGLGVRVGVLLPDLDRLVGLARNEARARLVEFRVVDAGLAREGARLRDGGEALEAVARRVVPELEGPVVAGGREDAVRVDVDRVYLCGIPTDSRYLQLECSGTNF